MFLRFLVLLVAVFVGVNAHAEVTLHLNNPNTDPLPVAVAPFVTEDAKAADYAQTVRDVIVGNLNNSAIFEVVEKGAYLQDSEFLVEGGPIFADWRVINSDILLSAELKVFSEGGISKILVEFRIFDIPNGKEIYNHRLKARAAHVRHLGHVMSDAIYTAVTGEPGYFATRIVYIGEEAKFNGQRTKKLCVMDQDGANNKCLTDGKSLVLTPRFDPQAQRIIYMSYESGVPRLYLLDLNSGKQRIVGDFKGLNSSPRFSPDGESVAMTLTQGHEGNSEIYTMRLDDRKLRRLTRNSAIDTSPSFSPDGKKIVFNSDRGGRPNLYIMDANGRNVKRLTFGKGRYFAPVWSPRGDLIAFVKQYKGRFHIGVIDPEGMEERLLTDSYMDESPTWSPNGRVISYARQMGDSTRIYSIDLTGYNERQLTTLGDASDPAWSPLL